MLVTIEMVHEASLDNETNNKEHKEGRPQCINCENVRPKTCRAFSESHETTEDVRDTRSNQLKRERNCTQMSETSALISTNASAAVQVDLYTPFGQYCPYVETHKIIDVFPERPFRILTASVPNSTINPARHQRILIALQPPIEIIHSENDEPSLYSMWQSLPDSVVVEHEKRFPGCLQQEQRHDTVQKSGNHTLNND